MANALSLEDVFEMTQLCVKFCRAIDTQEFDVLREVFTLDVRFEHHGVSSEGPHYDGLEAFLADLQQIGSVRSQHTTTNHEFAVDGHHVRGLSYTIAQHWRTESPSVYYLMGRRYEDRYVKTDVGWRITQRYAYGLWADGNPGVLTGQ